MVVVVVVPFWLKDGTSRMGFLSRDRRLRLPWMPRPFWPVSTATCSARCAAARAATSKALHKRLAFFVAASQRRNAVGCFTSKRRWP